MYLNLVQADNKLTIIETVSSYPRKNDCYKVLVENSITRERYTIDHMPIKQYDLIIRLRLAKMSKAVLKVVLEGIEAYVDYEKEVTSDDISMSNN